MKKLILTGLALAFATSTALAQEAPAAPPPAPMTGVEAPAGNPPPPGATMDDEMKPGDMMGGGHDRMKRHGHDRMGQDGPPPPPPTGFDIRMGKDMGLRVSCGDEPIAACIAAAKPLLDQIGTMMPPRPDAPPPPKN